MGTNLIVYLNDKLISSYIVDNFLIKKIQRNFFSVHAVYKINKDEFAKQLSLCRGYRQNLLAPSTVYPSAPYLNGVQIKATTGFYLNP